jgi:hypothetical protein
MKHSGIAKGNVYHPLFNYPTTNGVATVYAQRVLCGSMLKHYGFYSSTHLGAPQPLTAEDVRNLYLANREMLDDGMNRDFTRVQLEQSNGTAAYNHFHVAEVPFGKHVTLDWLPTDGATKV